MLGCAGLLSCGRVSNPVVPEHTAISSKTDCVYQGAFLGEDTITAAKIEDFEAMSGKKLDIVLKFLAFNTMGSSGGFPLAEAEVVSDKGAVLFIKLEPWSWAGADDDSFSLEKIIAGNFDEMLTNFARDAGNYDKSLFVSFGHEMNADWYPWADKPELYKEAYVHVHDLMSNYAGKITWVWDPNIDCDDISKYYPGNDYVDWIAVDGYNTQDYGASWKSAQQLFDTTIDDIASYGKPTMIGETACDANDENDETVRKPQWLYLAVEWITGKKKIGSSDNLIKGYVYFNFDKVEDGQLKNWEISRSEAKAQYKQALTDYSSFFKGITP